MADRTPKPRAWYRFEVRAEAPSEADLYVFGAIGRSFWDDDTVTAKKFVADLRALPKSVERIHLHVNSPGGDVFDAVTIANALREHPADVHVSIEGLAASAATVVTMAGARITIAENALMMIHEPWSYTVGTAAEMRTAAEALERVRDAIIATYRWHSELPAERLGEMMAAVTWMNAEEALENGFATEVGAEVKAAARLDQRMLAKLGPVPAKYSERLRASEGNARADPAEKEEKPPPAPARATGAEVIDLEAARREHYDRGRREALEAEQRRIADIEAIPATLRRPDLAGVALKLAARGLGLEEARSILLEVVAAGSAPEILTILPKTGGATAAGENPLSPIAIAERRRQQAEAHAKESHPCRI